MRNILLTGLVIGVASVAAAQNAPQPASSIMDRFRSQNQVAVPIPPTVSGNELPVRPQNQTTGSQPTVQQQKSSSVQTIIGTTTYDLQTNSSVDKRLLNIGGNLSAVWTYSADGNQAPSYTDRGTGYNYKQSGGSWGPYPTSRIETDRRGWPAIAVLANGGERVVSHANVNTTTCINSRSAQGSGTWTQDSIPSIPVVYAKTLWARVASGGPDGNTMHMIDISYPTGNNGVAVNGLDGFLNYSRSLNGGASWDIVRVAPPGVDDQNYNGFRADAYAIDAKDNIVAFVSGKLDDDWALWKSTDNGTTFTRTVIQDFPFTKYDAPNSISDVDGDGVEDTVFTTDGSYAILIDNNGTVHAWAGSMFVFDPTISDGLFYFPGTDGLLYWNENFGSNPPVVIAQCPDRDGDGQLTFADSLGGDYGTDGICSMPNAGIDAAGNLYVSYAALMENTDTGLPYSNSYRNVFMTTSSDGGTTWTTGINLSNSDFDEAVFASVAKAVDPNCVHIMWQQDGFPGYSVPPNGDHPVGSNDLIYDCIDPNLVLGIANNEVTPGVKFSVYPNPANSFVTLSYQTDKAVTMTIEFRNIMGQVVKSITKDITAPGNYEYSTNISDLSSGVYFVNTMIGNESAVSKFIKN